MPFVTPRTWIAGDVLTAAQLNQEIRDNVAGIAPLGMGAWTAWTPTVLQPGAVTFTNTRSVYTKIGRTAIVHFFLQVSGTGTAANHLFVGNLPVAAANATGGPPVGFGQILDGSAATSYAGTWFLNTTTNVGLIGDWSGNNGWGVGPSLAIAANDLIRGILIYETAT